MGEFRKPKRGKVTKAEEALLQERRAKALRLNVRGRTLERIVQISQEEAWEPWAYTSRQSVHQDITAALKEYKAERNASAGEWVAHENAKLDAYEEEAWRVLESLHYVVNQGEVVYVYPDEQPDMVKRGWARPQLDPETKAALEGKRAELQREPLTDNKPVLDALTVLLKIAERRTKLNGTDAPIKKQLDVSTSGNVDDRIAERLGRLEDLARGGQGSVPARDRPADSGAGAIDAGGPG